MGARALVSDIRCLGVARTVRKVRGALARAEVIVLCKRLDEIADTATGTRLRVAEIAWRDLGDLDAFNRRRCDRRATGRFAADLDHGRRGFVARLDGKVAGFYWWADRDHPHLEPLGIRLEDGDVYGYDFYVAEEHRGEGRAVEFLHGIETRLRNHGYARIWGYVRSDNRPARWLYAMRGYEAVGHVNLGRGHIR